MSDSKTLIQIGGLWKQTSKSGTVYLSGKLDADALEKLRGAQPGDSLLVFKNTRKQGERDPDYSVKIAQTSKDGKPKTSEPAKPAAFVNDHGVEVTDDDVPF